MTVPIKNHEYLIKQNIEYHYYREKIDGFVVLLHNSTDNSSEILKEMQKNIPICIEVVNDPVFMDAEFRTQMAKVAKDQMSADWIISNDVDEFICTHQANLHNVLMETKISIVYAYRYNMVPYVLPGYQYKSPPESYKFAVTKPIKIDKTRPFEEISAIDYLLKTQAGKAFCRAEGLISIGHGSHEIQHLNQQTEINNTAVIYHYPFSTKETFIKETPNKVKSVLSDITLREGQNWHVKLLKYILENGKLDSFASELFINNDTFDELIKKGLIEEVPYVFNYLNRL